jgi:Amt family ammonium transporter
MTPLVAVGLSAGSVATLAIFLLVRPVLGGRMIWPAIGAVAVTTVVTTTLGVATGAGTIDYFLGLSCFALPVLVLLEAAAIGSGADQVARWILMLAWGILVFPVVAVVPQLAMADCVTADCRFEDFGGALPLFVSSTVFPLLAWLPAGVRPRDAQNEQRALSGMAAVAAVFAVWLSFAAWLASMESAVDAYTPRILLAAFVAPIASAVGWFVVDRLRNIRRRTLRSLAPGLLAGMLAITPGAVSVSFPWSLVVGGLAGIIAGLVHSALDGQPAGMATRWGLVLVSATAVGFLAPPVAGDTVGILFSAQVSALVVPAIAFVGVCLYSVLISAPVWILLRRRAVSRPRSQPRHVAS